MTSQQREPGDMQTSPTPDPWQAVSYMLSGLIVYGLAGYGLDRWLGTSFLVGVGIVVGTGLGVFMIWARWGRIPADEPAPTQRHARGNESRPTRDQETQ